jgi:hypothetical protein
MQEQRFQKQKAKWNKQKRVHAEKLLTAVLQQQDLRFLPVKMHLDTLTELDLDVGHRPSA